jgi:hypothetical protein
MGASDSIHYGSKGTDRLPLTVRAVRVYGVLLGVLALSAQLGRTSGPTYWSGAVGALLVLSGTLLISTSRYGEYGDMWMRRRRTALLQSASLEGSIDLGLTPQATCPGCFAASADARTDQLPGTHVTCIHLPGQSGIHYPLAASNRLPSQVNNPLPIVGALWMPKQSTPGLPMGAVTCVPSQPVTRYPFPYVSRH